MRDVVSWYVCTMYVPSCIVPNHSSSRRSRIHRMSTAKSSSSPNEGESPSVASRAIDFLTLTRNLKTTKRTGWIRAGVTQPESIADHMYRMSLMAMIASRAANSASVNADEQQSQLDMNRCIQLALVHDLAEATVGDITPYCGVSDTDKYKLELNTMERIRDMLGPILGGERFLSLWQEYEAGQTYESKLLKDLDKIEMILQAQVRRYYCCCCCCLLYIRWLYPVVFCL